MYIIHGNFTTHKLIIPQTQNSSSKRACQLHLYTTVLIFTELGVGLIQKGERLKSKNSILCSFVIIFCCCNLHSVCKINQHPSKITPEY